DIFALWRAGLITDVSIPLNLTRYLASEPDTVVWKTAIDDLNLLEQVLALDPAYGRFQKHQARIMGPLVQSLGWMETSEDKSLWHLRARLRSELLSEAVAVNHAPTVKTALEYFAELRGEVDAGHASILTTLSPDVLNVIYDTGVICGTEDDYEWVLAQYLDSNSTAQDKARLLHALASAKLPYLQKRTLDLILQGHVRKQDIISLIDRVSLLSPETGTTIVWEFLMDSWPRIIKLWQGLDWTGINNLLEKVTGRFVEPLLIAEADRRFVLEADQGFFVPPNAQLSVRKGLEKARQNVAWLDRFGADIGGWLKRELRKSLLAFVCLHCDGVWNDGVWNIPGVEVLLLRNAVGGVPVRRPSLDHPLSINVEQQARNSVIPTRAMAAVTCIRGIGKHLKLSALSSGRVARVIGARRAGSLPRSLRHRGAIDTSFDIIVTIDTTLQLFSLSRLRKLPPTSKLLPTPLSRPPRLRLERTAT
ncbi:ERAP1-like C-terminal domain-containing protein, partial [Blyttiomyces helicus]